MARKYPIGNAGLNLESSQATVKEEHLIYWALVFFALFLSVAPLPQLSCPFFGP